MHPHQLPTRKISKLDRTFSKNVKRCDELLLKIDQIISTMQKFNRPVCHSENYNRTFQAIEESLKSRKLAGSFNISRRQLYYRNRKLALI